MVASQIIPLLCLVVARCHGAFHVDTVTNLILDDAGRVRIFHGVNTIEKLAPYLPSSGATNQINSLNVEDAKQLRSWGMNMVRLGVMWPGVMPSEGVVDHEYLSSVRTMIEMLDDYGIATIVDMHQDVLSPYTCGEGMPDWAYLKALDLVGFDRTNKFKAFPAPLLINISIDEDTGYANAEQCQSHQFFPYYTTFESEAAWHSLYSQPTMWDAVGDHWEAVAAALKGARGLLGYEMINEPWPAKGAEDSKLVLSDKHTLQPLYEALHARVRSADDDTLFFFEPIVLSSYEESFGHTTDFDQFGPGGEAYANRSVFAYHSYCANNAAGEPSPMALCRAVVAGAWGGVDRNLKHLGVGGFLTEFGAVGDGKNSLETLKLQAEGADARFQGWSYWTYKSFDDITTQNPATETFFYTDGSLQHTKIAKLARTYASAIACAGAPEVMAFDDATGAFHLSYAVGPDASATTVIYLSTEYYYAEGASVTVAPAQTHEVTYSEDGHAILTITHTSPAGTSIDVTVVPESR